MSQHLAAPIFKAIPSTGQMLPVVGLGTNAFREDILEQLREGMRHFASAGATMIDTAAVYGESEQVIGRLAAELQLRDRLFIATKITTGGGSGAYTQPGGRKRSCVISACRPRTTRIMPRSSTACRSMRSTSCR